MSHLSNRRHTRALIVAVALVCSGVPLPQAVVGAEPVNFGVIIQTFPAPDLRPSDLAFDGENLWVVTDGAVPTIWRLDPSDGTVLDSMPAPSAGAALGLDHDGFNLWGTTDDPGEIYVASDVDGSVLQSFSSPMAAPTGVVWDGADLWHSGTGEDLRLIDDLDGSTIRTLPAPGQSAVRGMAWDGTTLWVVDAAGTFDDAVYQLDPADGTEKIQFLPVGDSLSMLSGITYDGKYLWVSDLVDAEIHKVELGLHVGVWTGGRCPGKVRVRVSGETPNGNYVVAHGKTLGSFEIPGGACEGIPLDIDSIAGGLEVVADGTAEFILRGELGENVCGDYLQVVDLDTCLKSFVGRVPSE